MQYVSIMMGIVFIGFATLQYNDPDPYIWMPAYGWMAVLSFWSALISPANARHLRRAALASALFFLVWCIWSYTQTTGQWWNGEVERETGGLGICAVWSVVMGMRRIKDQESRG